MYVALHNDKLCIIPELEECKRCEPLSEVNWVRLGHGATDVVRALHGAPHVRPSYGVRLGTLEPQTAGLHAAAASGMLRHQWSSIGNFSRLHLTRV